MIFPSTRTGLGRRVWKALAKCAGCLAILVFVTLDEYNAVMRTGQTLEENEVLIYSNKSKTPIDFAAVSGYNDVKIIYLWEGLLNFWRWRKRRTAADMPTDTEIKNAVSATDTEAQYDDKAKRLLGNKIILAHILVKAVDEFHGMNPKDVVPYIESDPLISAVPVESGLTNIEKEKDGQRIVGMNTENAGLVSSQKERDFVKTNYSDIKRVFSIWVCMNMDGNSMAYVHLAKDDLIGFYPWKGRLDLLNIVLIGIANKLPEHDEKYELHRLLSAILSMELSAPEKLKIMENEYGISVDDKIREDVKEMCNLSQGIIERTIERTEEKTILNMHKKGYPLEDIAEVAEKSVEEIKAIIAKREPVLA